MITTGSFPAALQNGAKMNNLHKMTAQRGTEKKKKKKKKQPGPGGIVGVFARAMANGNRQSPWIARGQGDDRWIAKNQPRDKWIANKPKKWIAKS